MWKISPDHTWRGIYLILLVICLFPVWLNGQADSITYLEEIEVTAQRIDLTDVGKHTEVIDSQLLAMRQYNSLATVLATQTPLYVRSYGLGTLATLGIRGGNAGHTQLLWNGIPLRNPMLGLVDLALIPSFFTDEVSIHYGGHGAAFGSGAVGGMISLSNQYIASSNVLQVNLSGGSWDAFIAEIKVDYGFKSLRFSTRVLAHEAENNYRYRLNKDLPELNQTHHHLTNRGLLQEINWRINDRESLVGRFWYQYTNRQIPPTSTQVTSKSAQQDKSLRTSLQWMRTNDKAKWQIKAALLEEEIDFQDSLILLYTQNKFQTWLAEGEGSFDIAPGISMTGGVYAEFVQASSVNYDTGTSRTQYAAFTSLRYILEDWVWRFQMREELTDEQWSPLLVDFASEWSGIKHLVLKSSISRNYRIPTLNDLYWRPGGNPELLPEEGWTAEVGAHYKAVYTKRIWSTSLTGFVRKIDNWIMWLPPVKDLRNYWSPLNIAEVNSSGMEFRGDLEVIKEDWHLHLNAGLDLTWSTFGAAIPEFMIEEGNQLFYVPVENFLAGCRIVNAHWSGYYYHHWYGASPGINEDVASGNVGSAGINYAFIYQKMKCALYLQADNVWNVPYRIIERRPMPGRSFMAGVRFTFF